MNVTAHTARWHYSPRTFNGRGQDHNRILLRVESYCAISLNANLDGFPSTLRLLTPSLESHVSQVYFMTGGS
jgi:hypothetical protein